MNDPVETFKSQDGKMLLEIYCDEDPISPTEWDSIGTMVCGHSRYTLGNVQCDSFEEHLENEGLTENDIAIKLPLWLYDHSGLTMSCGDRTYPYNDQWDSGLVGTIYVTKQKLREEYNVKRISKTLLQKVEGYLKGQVENYDTYLRGDVYGYQTFTLEKCASECTYCTDEDHKVDADSCWGFFGDDGIKQIKAETKPEEGEWIAC